jgi:hypothetical protein
MSGSGNNLEMVPPRAGIICDGHRRWLDANVKINIAALEGVAKLNEY